MKPVVHEHLNIRSSERGRLDVLLRDVAPVAHRPEDAVRPEEVERRCGSASGGQLTRSRSSLSIGRIRRTVVFSYLTCVHDEDAIAVDNGTESVRNDEQGLVAELFPDSRLDAGIGRKVDRRGRFAASTAVREPTSQSGTRRSFDCAGKGRSVLEDNDLGVLDESTRERD